VLGGLSEDIGERIREFGLDTQQLDRSLVAGRGHDQGDHLAGDIDIGHGGKAGGAGGIEDQPGSRINRYHLGMDTTARNGGADHRLGLVNRAQQGAISGGRGAHPGIDDIGRRDGQLRGLKGKALGSDGSDLGHGPKLARMASGFKRKNRLISII
jgi:hypothetical protein